MKFGIYIIMNRLLAIQSIMVYRRIMRKINTMKLIYASLISNVLIILISFFSRKIFIEYIGIEYLGLSGLLSSILTMLSLVELGVGQAILFSFYKPISENNIEEIKSINELYRKIYLVIGCVVLLLGLALLPFLGYFVEMESYDYSVNLIYLL